jgi:hypothetical protein
MTCQEPVAHVYNPSYSGGRDQEDCSLKPAWAKCLRPYLEKPITHTKKRTGGVTQGVDRVETPVP